MATPTGSDTAAPKVSKLVLDEWEADVARLNLPSRSEVQVMQQQLADLEAQIDQLMQNASQPQERD